MNIAQPQEGVVLPEDVQSALDSARNNVTILEQEEKRLHSVIGQQEYQIRMHNERIASQEVVLSSLQQSIDLAKKNLQQVLADVKAEEENLSSKKGELNRIIEEIVAKSNDLLDRERNIEKQESELVSNRNMLSQRENDVNEREASVIAREKKLKDFVSGI